MATLNSKSVYVSNVILDTKPDKTSINATQKSMRLDFEFLYNQERKGTEIKWYNNWCLCNGKSYNINKQLYDLWRARYERGELEPIGKKSSGTRKPRTKKKNSSNEC